MYVKLIIQWAVEEVQNKSWLYFVSDTVFCYQCDEVRHLVPPEAPSVVPFDAVDVFCWSAGFLGHPPISNFIVSCKSKSACNNAEFNSVVPLTNFITVSNSRKALCTNVSGPSADYTCTIGANSGAFDVNTSTDVSTRPGSRNVGSRI